MLDLAGRRTLTRRTSSIEALLNLFRGTPSHKTVDPMTLGPHPHKPAHMDVARLDACHCGSHGCVAHLCHVSLLLCLICFVVSFLAKTSLLPESPLVGCMIP